MKPASVRWIIDRNPFYMLSACCGLAGCWLLGDISRPDLADVAIKVSAVLAYEIAKESTVEVPRIILLNESTDQRDILQPSRVHNCRDWPSHFGPQFIEQLP